MIHDLPASPCTLRVTAGGKIHERVHDPRVGKARIELPIMGQVAFTWTRAVVTENDAAGRVILRSSDPAGVPLEFFIGDTAEGSHTFAAVSPGEYTIAVECLSPGAVEGTSVYKAAMTPLEVSVQPEQTAHIDSAVLSGALRESRAPASHFT